MLNFARRSWNLSHDLLLRNLAEGVVDPSLLLCGWALDMGASEDGVGTKTMGEFKSWLCHIARTWHLDLMDSDPSIPVNLTIPEPARLGSSPSCSPNVRHLHVPPEATPSPRSADARYYVKDPIDR